MTFIVQALEAECAGKKLIEPLFSDLREKGFVPLIMQAKQSFMSIFQRGVPTDTLISQLSLALLSNDEDIRSREFIRRYNEMFSRGATVHIPKVGDVFFSGKQGLLYLLLSEPFFTSQEKGRKSDLTDKIEIGYLGDSNQEGSLTNFSEAVTDFFSANNQSLHWEPVQRLNSSFEELRQSEKSHFVTAEIFSDEDSAIAEMLEDESVRQVALNVKSTGGGGMLVEELSKSLKQEELERIAERLIKTNFIVREYAIICPKTQKQISRVQTYEAIETAAQLGFVCSSCGRPYSEESIKELFRSTSELKRMLDKSFWVTARLVSVLRKLGVQDSHILLNLEEGPNEIDAAVDVDGLFLMIELKDDEFAMGHAYRFGSRISIYKPQCAIIIATKGIAPEVRDHFKRADQKSKIVYVEHLNELYKALHKIVEEARVQQANEIFSYFEPVRMPISQLLFENVGIQPPGKRKDAS
jgi:hypothetical protein